MKALVVGYGSIGKRRAKDLTELGVEVVTTDPVTTELKDPLAAIREHAPGNLVVISSPSSEHTWQTMQAIDAGALAILVEKPSGMRKPSGVPRAVWDGAAMSFPF